MVAAVGFSRENPTHGDELALGKERPGHVTVNVLDVEDKNKECYELLTKTSAVSSVLFFSDSDII